ncbi:MAG: thermonuclease family protein [Alphaproteobacteria bacterium]|nr:thermonuclease family protein [Alphaproteobacteria bacterium]
MKRIAIILSLLLCIPAYAETYKAVDGDSLSCGNRRIRLDGIDAPEFMQTCYTAEGSEYPCGQEALNYLSNLVDSRNIECRCQAETDKYGREICECFADGLSLNQAMVAAGWAVCYRSAEYLPQETAATEQKLCIWQGKYMRPALFRILAKYQD